MEAQDGFFFNRFYTTLLDIINFSSKVMYPYYVLIVKSRSMEGAYG